MKTGLNARSGRNLRAWMLDAISSRGTEQAVHRVRSVSTAGKNRTPAPRAWASKQALLARRLMRLAGCGYTIVEVMIVLAITGGLLVMVMVMISGQQGKTEFVQSINDIQAQINDVINNVATGFYANNGNLSCSAGAGGPILSTTSKDEGTNLGCVFMGRAIQFDVGGKSSAFNLYDIVGLQNNGDNEAAQNLTEASPEAIAPPNGADTTQPKQTQYGLQAARMYYTSNGVNVPFSTIAFMSSLASYSNGNLLAGSQQVELHPVKTTASIGSGGESAQNAVGKINATNMNFAQPLSSDFSVTICFNSGGSKQNGVIVIGGHNRQLTTKLTINAGQCS